MIVPDWSGTIPVVNGDADSGDALSSGDVSEQITITGTGFGSGPNVILFDSFSGGNAGEVINHTAPEIGEWAGDNLLGSGSVAGPEYYEYNGRNWMTTRKLSEVLNNNTINLTGLRFLTSSDFSEFRFCYRQVLPTGFKFPGTSTPNTTNNNDSNWKMNWFGNSSAGNAAGAAGGEPDIILPTNGSAGDVWVSGNNINPRWYDYNESRWRGAYVGRSATEEDLFMYYQKPETTELGTDGVMEFGNSNASSGFGRKYSDQATIFQGQQGTVNPRVFDMFLFNGWMGNAGALGYENVMPLMTDAYLAVGPNSRACIVVSNASTLSASTEFAVIPPDSWSDTEVTATKKAHESSLDFNHLILADGTLRENL